MQESPQRPADAAERPGDRAGRSRTSGRGGITVGRIFGVRIQVHPSWFIVFALVVFYLASAGAPDRADRLSPGLNLLRAVIVALIFFASVLAHELAHALVARRLGVAVSEITLFIFGGAANLEQEAPRPRTEALMAVAGPVASLVVGVLFFAIWGVLRDDSGELARVVAGSAFALGGINVLLAIFNLIPGFPMDGGRILRALLWGVTGNFVRATRFATFVGRGFAYLLIAVGFAIAISGDIAQGIWLAFIGWFLNQAAEASYRKVALDKLVSGVRVEHVMDRDVAVVNPNLTLDTFVEQHLMSGQASLYPVLHDELLVGTVELGQVRQVPRDQWPMTRVTDVMTRGTGVRTVTEREPLADAITQFEESGTAAIPVVDPETRRQLLGLLTRDGVFRAIRARSELSA